VSYKAKLGGHTQNYSDSERKLNADLYAAVVRIGGRARARPKSLPDDGQPDGLMGLMAISGILETIGSKY
jgi:hypothetical protein